jgi:hypothetical protein
MNGRSAPGEGFFGTIDLITTRNCRARLKGSDSAGGAGQDELIDFGENTADFQLRSLIECFRDDYDLILFDTCALDASSRDTIDPVILAGQTDASILLTSRATNNREVLNSAKRVLAENEVKLMAMVYNSGVHNG